MMNKKLSDVKQNSKYKAALYMRLSKDDEGVGESASIKTQRKMLTAYAKENHFTIYDEYIDDGISGTTFNRPQFKRMLEDIEANKVNMVITKDLSRLGRDYILSGQYTEIYFPEKKVRYIAINDGYDSDNPYNDIAPFKNVINEMYARDISKKIRSSFVAKMKDGEFIASFAPYGYQRDPNDKHRLSVDEEAAKVVRGIFTRAAEGMLPAQIAEELNDRHVPTPLEYRCIHHPQVHIERYKTHRKWTSGSITKMLRNPVYLGHLLQGKTTKISFRSGLTIQNPQENWYITQNAHEALVSEELFEMAGRRSHQRTCIKKGEFNNLFSGIAKCADCGKNMSAAGTHRKGATANLVCGRYKLYGRDECSNHFISYDMLYDMVFSLIRKFVKLSDQEEDEIIKTVRQRAEKQKEKTNIQEELASLETRNRELDSLIEKLYEDYAARMIGAERMNKLLGKYEAESRDIQNQINATEQKEKFVSPENSDDKLKKLLKAYTEPTELTQEMLYCLIDRIEISQGIYEKTEFGRRKRQTIKIYFRFSGKSMPITYNM